MADILAKRHLSELADFAWSNVLLAFDFDGTLAPIVPTPANARMRPETRRLLGKVAHLYPCVAISGRTLGDLSKRLGRIPVWHMFGTFGHEPAAGTERAAARVREWVDQLSRRLPAHPGIIIEKKKYSVTIHHRHVCDKRVLAAIAAAVRHLPGVRALGGIKAISLLPHSGPDKGVALQRARRLFGCDTAIYVGDDATDEDAFASARADRLLSIRIGVRGKSRARYRLKRQSDLDRLLRLLLKLRAPGSRSARRHTRRKLVGSGR